MNLRIPAIHFALLFFLSGTAAFGSGKSFESNRLHQQVPCVRSEKDVRQFVSSEAGVILNVPGPKIPERIRLANVYLSELLANLIDGHPDRDRFHWRVAIYNDTAPGAWAQLISSDGSSLLGRGSIHRLYGVSADKPIAIVAITTKMLQEMQSESELAFVFAHEATHHLEGHTKDATTPSLGDWLSSQSNEVVADKGALDSIRGKFDLDGSIRFLERLAPLPTFETGQHRYLGLHSAAQDALTADHHHVSVRLNLLQVHAEEMKRQSPNAASVIDRPIPSFLKAITGKPAKHLRMNLQVRARLFEWTNRFLDDARLASDPVQVAAFVEEFKYESKFWRNEDGSEILNEILDRISSSGISVDQRAKVLITVLSGPWTDDTAFFGPGELDRLLENTKFPNNQRLVRILAGLDSGTEDVLSAFPAIYRKDWLKFVMRSASMQTLFSALAKNNAAWSRVVRDRILSESSAIFDGSELNRAMLDVAFPSDLKFAGPLSKEAAWLAINRMSNLNPTEIRSMSDESITALLWRFNDAEFVGGMRSRFGVEVVNSMLHKFHVEVEERVSHFDLRELYAGSTDSDAIRARYAKIKAWIDLIETDPKRLGGRNPERFADFVISFVNEEYSLPYQFAEGLMPGGPIAREFEVALTSVDVSWEKKIEMTRVMLKQRSNYTLYLIEHDPTFATAVRDLLAAGRGRGESGVDRLLANASSSENQSVLQLLKQVQLFEQIIDQPSGRNRLDKILSSHESELVAAIAKSAKRGRTFTQIPPNYAALLLEWTKRIVDQSSPREHIPVIERTIKVLGSNYLVSPSDKNWAERHLISSIMSLNGETLLRRLETPWVRQILPERFLVDQLDRGIVTSLGRNPSRAEINSVWSRIAEGFDFESRGRVVGSQLRHRIAERFRIQSNEVATFLPMSSMTDTQAMKKLATGVRGWSAITLLIQSEDVSSQLDAIDYFMGRNEKVPPVISRTDAYAAGREKLVEAASKLRAELMGQPVPVRALFINSLFRGKGASLSDPANQTKVISRLAQGLETTAKRNLALDVAQAMIGAEGRNASLTLSTIFAQLPEGADRKISEEAILKVFLESYGVPGWKLAQYLAFTGDFKAYESLLAVYQDAAPAPGYFDIITYVEKSLGKQIDLGKIQITRLLGAGSVNLALEYVDLPTGETRVLNIPRENIEGKTRIDFKRFRSFLDQLAALSRPTKDYTFVRGLGGIIEESVELEFDRAVVLQRQKDAIETYVGDVVDGWKIRTVSEHGLYGDSILMGLARGMTARKLSEKDPKMYRKAVRAFYDHEHSLLLGKRSKELLKTGKVRLGNPDIHDGQLLIDVDKATITVIDFGQAVPVSELQRNFGLEMITLVSGLRTKADALRSITEWSKKLGHITQYTAADIDKVWAVTDQMDRFVRLISMMRERGAKVPIESIHFVLAVNRLAKLGKKIGRYPTVSVGTKLVANDLKIRFSKLMDRCNRLLQSPWGT